MTTEELLRPRYKIIAPIPFKEEEDFWRVGEILDRDWGWHGDDDDGFKYHISDYPHLFKKLEWYEERKIEEMPEYVKVIREDCVKDTGLYCKVFKWSVFDDKTPSVKGQFGAELEGYKPLYLARTELNFPGQIYGRLNAINLQPATAAEYEQYINQKEK